MKWRSGPHTPEKSGLPSGVRGAWPDGAALFSTPPPVRTDCAAWLAPGRGATTTKARSQPDKCTLTILNSFACGRRYQIRRRDVKDEGFRARTGAMGLTTVPGSQKPP